MIRHQAPGILDSGKPLVYANCNHIVDDGLQSHLRIIPSGGAARAYHGSAGGRS